MSLIDAAYDKKADVRRIIMSSLVDIGKKKPKMVLSSSHSYLRKHNKVDTQSSKDFFYSRSSRVHCHMFPHPNCCNEIIPPVMDSPMSICLLKANV